MNMVVLIGRVGRALEVKIGHRGVTTGRFRMATDEVWCTPEGEVKTWTTWHTVTIHGPYADTLEQIVKVGQLVYVRGRLAVRKIKQANGQLWVEIVAEEVSVLARAKDDAEGEDEDDG